MYSCDSGTQADLAFLNRKKHRTTLQEAAQLIQRAGWPQKSKDGPSTSSGTTQAESLEESLHKKTRTNVLGETIFREQETRGDLHNPIRNNPN